MVNFEILTTEQVQQEIREIEEKLGMSAAEVEDLTDEELLYRFSTEQTLLIYRLEDLVFLLEHEDENEDSV